MGEIRFGREIGVIVALNVVQGKSVHTTNQSENGELISKDGGLMLMQQSLVMKMLGQKVLSGRGMTSYLRKGIISTLEFPNRTQIEQISDYFWSLVLSNFPFWRVSQCSERVSLVKGFKHTS
jgi:hypothetical protein